MLLTVGILSTVGCSRRWTDNKVRESQRRGDRIAEALLKYKEKNNVFPPSLDSLVPTYIESIPNPVAGNKEWRYETLEGGQRAWLVFEGNRREQPSCWYDFRSGEWYLDTK